MNSSAAMENRIYDVIRASGMICRGEGVLAGVSGGADSVCLFRLLLGLRERIGFELSVVHVNHGMRERAADEAEFVRELVEGAGIPFYLREINVPELRREWKCSAEDAARRARYEAFAAVMREAGAEKLAVAHNLNDQAETVIFKMCRGAGIRGVSGIAPVSRIKAGNDELCIIRPLLFSTRDEIEGYLSAVGAGHVEDDSNETDEYTRNRIRHHVIPMLCRDINGSAPVHIAGAADSVREALEYTERMTAEGLDRVSVSEEGVRGIDLYALSEEDPYLKKQIVIKYMKQSCAGHELSSAHIRAVCEMAEHSEGTETADLPGGRCAVRRYGRLLITDRGAQTEDDRRRNADEALEIGLPGEGEETTLALPGGGSVRLSAVSARCALDELREGAGASVSDTRCTKWFDYDTIKCTLVFRKRRPGDVINVGRCEKKLTREMIDLKIPADIRNAVWLMADGSRILWIVGVRRSEDAKVTETSRLALKAEYFR